MFFVFQNYKLILNVFRLIDVFAKYFSKRVCPNCRNALSLPFDTLRQAQGTTQGAAYFPIILLQTSLNLIFFLWYFWCHGECYFLHQHPSFHFLTSFFWSANVSLGYFCLCSSAMALRMLSSSTFFSSHS